MNVEGYEQQRLSIIRETIIKFLQEKEVCTVKTNKKNTIPCKQRRMGIEEGGGEGNRPDGRRLDCFTG